MFVNEDFEFYSIEQDAQTKEKTVHIWGYVYNSYDGTDKPYRLLEYTNFIIPLSDFISEDFDYEMHASLNPSYLTDITGEEAEEFTANFFGNQCALKPRPFTELTKWSRVGNYVNRPVR